MRDNLPTTYKKITGYTIVQAWRIIGCAKRSYISTLITSGKLTVVGEIPHRGNNRKLLDVAGVLSFAGEFEGKGGDKHVFQVTLTKLELREVEAAFPELSFKDQTAKRKAKHLAN